MVVHRVNRAAASTPDCRIAPPNILRKRCAADPSPASPATAEPATSPLSRNSTTPCRVLRGAGPLAIGAFHRRAPSRCRRSPAPLAFAITPVFFDGPHGPAAAVLRVLDDYQARRGACTLSGRRRGILRIRLPAAVSAGSSRPTAREAPVHVDDVAVPCPITSSPGSGVGPDRVWFAIVPVGATRAPTAQQRPPTSLAAG
jgi:hypothetical protein